MNKNIRQYNDKGEAHGYFEIYFNDDGLMYKCFYYNDKEIGYEESYGDSLFNVIDFKIFHII